MSTQIITGTNKHNHIIPILKTLHWLPVELRIKLKILLFIFKVMSDVAPSYIRDLSSNYGQILFYKPPVYVAELYVVPCRTLSKNQGIIQQNIYYRTVRNSVQWSNVFKICKTVNRLFLNPYTVHQLVGYSRQGDT